MAFCTYFNSGLYAIKGWICIYTLFMQNPTSTMYILCFDKEAFVQAKTILQSKIFKDGKIIPIAMEDFEDRYPQLVGVRNTRTTKEYYVTTKPFLPDYIFNKYGEKELVFVDSDMAFWGNPQEIFEIFQNHSLLITDHELDPIPRAGRYNVGLVGFKNDENCKTFLKWWQDKCIQWCKWTVGPNGAFAEQGYLNILHDKPNKFAGTLSCPQPGINLGPWNIAKHKVGKKAGKLVLDNKFNLITYHYHEFKMLEGNDFFPTGWEVTTNDIELLYKPYVKIYKKVADGKIW